MTYLIGLDIGTSAAKAAIINADGRLIASMSREYPIHTPQPGWAEQDPADWLAAALACVRDVVRESGIDATQVAGMGLTGQMHSLVVTREDGSPLRPAMIWADQRSSRQVRRLTSAIGQNRLAELAGNPIAAGFMLASWAWLREYEPRLVAETRRLLLPKDWVRAKLTGQFGAEPSDASSTLLFDPHRRAWSQPILAAAGIRPEWLPPISPSSAVAGELLEEVARDCGLPAGLPVVFGCSDVTAQALALGVTEPGTVSVTIGTGGQLFAPLPDPRHDPQLRVHLFCHALPDLWHHEAAILSAGLALRWMRDNLWPGSSFESLASAAQKVQAGKEGLFFLPYLAGERTPYMDPGLRAAFLGLGLRHEQPHLIRAAMEGVVFALRQGLELLESLAGTETRQERLVASGGATRHWLWLQLQADIFHRPIFVYEAQEATARGAALLAGIGTGVYPSVQAALEQAVGVPARLVYPDTVSARHYDTAFREYVDWANLVTDRYRLGDIT